MVVLKINQPDMQRDDGGGALLEIIHARPEADNNVAAIAARIAVCA